MGWWILGGLVWLFLMWCLCKFISIAKVKDDDLFWDQDYVNEDGKV